MCRFAVEIVFVRNGVLSNIELNNINVLRNAFVFVLFYSTYLAIELSPKYLANEVSFHKSSLNACQ